MTEASSHLIQVPHLHYEISNDEYIQAELPLQLIDNIG